MSGLMNECHVFGHFKHKSNFIQNHDDSFIIVESEMETIMRILETIQE